MWSPWCRWCLITSDLFLIISITYIFQINAEAQLKHTNELMEEAIKANVKGDFESAKTIWDTNEMYDADTASGDGGATEPHTMHINALMHCKYGDKISLWVLANDVGDGGGNVTIDAENTDASISSDVTWFQGKLITSTVTEGQDIFS